MAREVPGAATGKCTRMHLNDYEGISYNLFRPMCTDLP